MKKKLAPTFCLLLAGYKAQQQGLAYIKTKKYDNEKSCGKICSAISELKVWPENLLFKNLEKNYNVWVSGKGDSKPFYAMCTRPLWCFKKVGKTSSFVKQTYTIKITFSNIRPSLVNCLSSTYHLRVIFPMVKLSIHYSDHRQLCQKEIIFMF